MLSKCPLFEKRYFCSFGIRNGSSALRIGFKHEHMILRVILTCLSIDSENFVFQEWWFCFVINVFSKLLITEHYATWFKKEQKEKRVIKMGIWLRFSSGNTSILAQLYFNCSHLNLFFPKKRLMMKRGNDKVKTIVKTELQIWSSSFLGQSYGYTREPILKRWLTTSLMCPFELYIPPRTMRVMGILLICWSCYTNEIGATTIPQILLNSAVKLTNNLTF